MSGRTFTEVQLEALESEFNKSNYHDVFSRDEMQNRMELPEQRSQVKYLTIEAASTDFPNKP